ncbi:oxygen-insensitive NAD(P)H nitroreductase [Pantoea sp. 1.19]|uniref:oxygen-insensitive NAD(P)H nitroreductase n=1 Tax=Pantoea sp. 1.19 TaxID=1925589 RepID=UPI00094904BA|nr:oxygen-insensitive NAD(P)H nitroreductase [Pantoea sp. 1.19]
MNLKKLSLERYSTKSYDSSKTIPPGTLHELMALLRYAPSSVNSQPWHFLLVGSHDGKARLTRAVGDAFAFNQSKVRDASHTVVFCVRRVLTDAYLADILAQEAADGRFAKPDAEATTDQVRKGFVNIHREAGDVSEWMEKQVYLALGSGLLGAAALGLDATPIEGFDTAAVDAEFGLAEQGLRSLVLMTVGYRSESDFNAALPKSRLREQAVVTEL